MKLRLRHNSIRLRLLKGEVAEFRETGSVSEEIVFPGGTRFIYSVVRNDAVESVSASIDGPRVTVSIPAAEADAWADSDEVGIDTRISVGDGHELRILIEKDFVCIDRKNDPDNADAFPNPSIKC